MWSQPFVVVDLKSRGTWKNRNVWQSTELLGHCSTCVPAWYILPWVQNKSLQSGWMWTNITMWEHERARKKKRVKTAACNPLANEIHRATYNGYTNSFQWRNRWGSKGLLWMHIALARVVSNREIRIQQKERQLVVAKKGGQVQRKLSCTTIRRSLHKAEGLL